MLKLTLDENMQNNPRTVPGFDEWNSINKKNVYLKNKDCDFLVFLCRYRVEAASAWSTGIL